MVSIFRARQAFYGTFPEISNPPEMCFDLELNCNNGIFGLVQQKWSELLAKKSSKLKSYGKSMRLRNGSKTQFAIEIFLGSFL